MGLLSSREDICCQDGDTLLSVSHTLTEDRKNTILWCHRCFAPAACLVWTRALSVARWTTSHHSGCWVTKSWTSRLDLCNESHTKSSFALFLLWCFDLIAWVFRCRMARELERVQSFVCNLYQAWLLEELSHLVTELFRYKETNPVISRAQKC